jgi:hypothetical protein
MVSGRHVKTLKGNVLVMKQTMLKKYLALSLRSGWLCTWFRLPQFKSSLNINLAAFFERLKVSVGSFTEGENSMEGRV